MRSRQPKQLVLAFFGEHVVDQDVPPLRASVADQGARGRGCGCTRNAGDARPARAAGSAHPRTPRSRDHVLPDRRRRRAASRGDGARARASSLRTARHGMDARHVHGARGAAHAAAPAAVGSHVEGFAPLRDGLWLAPGELDLDAALEPLRADLPTAAITAFHARELSGYGWPTTCGPPGTSRTSAPSISGSSAPGANRRPRARREARSPRARCSSRLAALLVSTPASPRVHGRGVAGRSLVRGLLGRPRGARSGIHRAVRRPHRRSGTAPSLVRSRTFIGAAG